MPSPYDSTSVADILATFLVTLIVPINGRQNLDELLRVLRILCRCAGSITSNLSPLGYLFVSLNPTNYAYYSPTPVTVPVPTPDAPTFTDAMKPSDREVARLAWKAHKMDNDNIRNMNEAHTGLFLGTIGEDYKKYIGSSFIGQTTRTFIDIFASFITKYGKIGPFDIENNKTRMTQRWDPNTPIELLFNQINEAAEFSFYAGHPIADNNKVQAMEVLILKTGNFPVEYKDWRSNLQADRTWNFFQEFGSIQFDLRQETETIAGTVGYGNATIDKKNDDESISIYNETVANFGSAFAANSNAFAQLMDTNTSLAGNMGNIQNQLNAITTQLQQIQMVASATQLSPPPQQVFQNHMPVQTQQQYPPQLTPPQVQYNAPHTQNEPPMQQNYQPNYNTQQQNNFGRGYGHDGNRGGGRGRERGRGYQQGWSTLPAYQQGQHNQHHGQQNYQQYNKNPQQQMGYQGNGGRNTINAPYSNNTKRFPNWNYCHTHGYDVPDHHDSSNCRHPGPFHVWNANRNNTCNGFRKNMHKTCLLVQHQQQYT